MNGETYITEINTLEDAGKLFKLIKKDLDIELEIVYNKEWIAPLCPRLYYGAEYTILKVNTLMTLDEACTHFALSTTEPEMFKKSYIDVSKTRNSFAVFYNENMPEGRRICFFSIFDWKIDEIINIPIPSLFRGRTPRPNELYHKITISALKQHLLDTVRKYKQFEVELKKKEIKDAVLGYEGN